MMLAGRRTPSRGPGSERRAWAASGSRSDAWLPDTWVTADDSVKQLMERNHDTKNLKEQFV